MARTQTSDIETYLSQYAAVRGSHFSGFSKRVEPFQQFAAPVRWLVPDARVRTSDPFWRDQVASGLDASGYYFRRLTTQKPYRFTCTDQHTSGGFKFDQGFWTGFGTVDVSKFGVPGDRYDAAVADLAVARLRRRIGNNVKQVQTLVPAAELHRLRSTIRALAYSGLDIARALIDIKRSKGKSAYQYAAHAWLQWSFAIKPTVADGQAILETIEQHLKTVNEKKFTDYGVAKKVWHTSSNGELVRVGYYSYAPRKIAMTHTLSYRYVAGYKVPFRGSDDYSASERFGLEPAALVPVIWELTAFSWLFDYFTTIGDYLDDTFTADPTTTIYCNCTRKYEVVARISLGNSHSVANGGGTSSLTHHPGTSGFKEIERTTLPNIPTRQLRFRTSDEIGKNAVNKLLNLVSVAIGGRAFSNRFK